MLLVADYKFVDLDEITKRNIMDFFYFAEFKISGIKKQKIK